VRWIESFENFHLFNFLTLFLAPDPTITDLTFVCPELWTYGRVTAGQEVDLSKRELDVGPIEYGRRPGRRRANGDVVAAAQSEGGTPLAPQPAVGVDEATRNNPEPPTTNGHSAVVTDHAQPNAVHVQQLPTRRCRRVSDKGDNEDDRKRDEDFVAELDDDDDEEFKVRGGDDDDDDDDSDDRSCKLLGEGRIGERTFCFEILLPSKVAPRDVTIIQLVRAVNYGLEVSVDAIRIMRIRRRMRKRIALTTTILLVNVIIVEGRRECYGNVRQL